MPIADSNSAPTGLRPKKITPKLRRPIFDTASGILVSSRVQTSKAVSRPAPGVLNDLSGNARTKGKLPFASSYKKTKAPLKELSAPLATFTVNLKATEKLMANNRKPKVITSKGAVPQSASSIQVFENTPVLEAVSYGSKSLKVAESITIRAKPKIKLHRISREATSCEPHVSTTPSYPQFSTWRARRCSDVSSKTEGLPLKALLENDSKEYSNGMTHNVYQGKENNRAPYLPPHKRLSVFELAGGSPGEGVHTSCVLGPKPDEIHSKGFKAALLLAQLEVKNSSCGESTNQHEVQLMVTENTPWKSRPKFDDPKFPLHSVEEISMQKDSHHVSKMPRAASPADITRCMLKRSNTKESARSSSIYSLPDCTSNRTSLDSSPPKTIRWDPVHLCANPISTCMQDDNPMRDVSFESQAIQAGQQISDDMTGQQSCFKSLQYLKKTRDKKMIAEFAKTLREIQYCGEPQQSDCINIKDLKRLDPRVPEFKPLRQRINQREIQSEPLVISKYHGIRTEGQQRYSKLEPSKPRKRAVIDDKASHGREVDRFDTWYGTLQLAEFAKRYPLTGMKATAVHLNERLPVVPLQTVSRVVVESGPSKGRYAAVIQQRLEFLLLKEKERKAFQICH